ncbi:hypothetical protein PROFUN_07507 [Planoprotostelium fungivorum]|uniref:Uncharacterized protein n=1 Tax=Planoprotostelium fungivorum TaxID=1890364 RepID=A0A2P6NLM2_9EUKA|nr:hypothetical protein PROFUN_07507 [Planoprotostelium fungivorum]
MVLRWREIHEESPFSTPAHFFLRKPRGECFHRSRYVVQSHSTTEHSLAHSNSIRGAKYLSCSTVELYPAIHYLPSQPGRSQGRGTTRLRVTPPWSSFASIIGGQLLQ